MRKSDFFSNTGGLNLTDSPFYIQDGQAAGGYNFEYTKTGAVTKVRGIQKVNGAADSQTNILGLAIQDTASGDKTVVVSAGTKIQTLDLTTQAITNIAEDTLAAGTDFFSATSTQQVVSANFNSVNSNLTWLAGGGLTLPYAYNGTTATQNGSAFATGGAYSVVASADFVSSNSIAITINTRTYTITFSGSNAITLQQVASALSTDADVVSATTSGSHTVLVTGRAGVALSISGIVTSGASQPTIAVTTTTAPSAAMTLLNNGSGTGGVSWATGVYYYALVARKASTQALSNAACDKSVTISNASDSVKITFPTDIDSTKYDMWYIYRSSVGGVLSFTAGTLVAKVPTSLASYTDINVVLATSQNVPRAGNTVLDNSPLPSATYNSITTFKRRLVAAENSTVHFSDLDKSESFPAGATITVPSGGNITALQVIGYNSSNTGTTDEYLMVFKQRELWVITGTGAYNTTTGLYDYTLKFIDAVGCISQALAVKCNGFVAWVDYRGIYIWSGLDKPVYCSRPIEGLFGFDGDLDKTNLHLGFGVFFRKKNMVIWTLSHRTMGINKISIKLDLRLTVPKLSENFSGNNILDGVFLEDSSSTALFAGVTYLPSNNSDEIFLVADRAGFIYRAYYATSDNGSGIEFSWLTKASDLGEPGIAKQFSKVVAFIDQSVAKNLVLNYWAGYRVLMAQESQISRSMDTGIPLKASLWDNASWDVSNWDEYNIQMVPVVFNLSSDKNNNQGDAIQLRFSQADTDAPVTIYGYSIFWDSVAARK